MSTYVPLESVDPYPKRKSHWIVNPYDNGFEEDTGYYILKY